MQMLRFARSSRSRSERSRQALLPATTATTAATTSVPATADADPLFWPDASDARYATDAPDAAVCARIADVAMLPVECPGCVRDGLTPRVPNSTAQTCDAHAAQFWLHTCMALTDRRARLAAGIPADEPWRQPPDHPLTLTQVGDRYYALDDAAVVVSLLTHSPLDAWVEGATRDTPAQVVRFTTLAANAITAVTLLLQSKGYTVVVWAATDLMRQIHSVHPAHPAGVEPGRASSSVAPSVPAHPPYLNAAGRPCRLYPSAPWLWREGLRGAQQHGATTNPLRFTGKVARP